MNYVEKIKFIGKLGKCSDKDLHLFLPNYPTLSGDEFIFRISWGNSKKYIDDDVEYFIKGLHLIEEKYKKLSGSDFGFGSPSPTFKVIEELAGEDFEKAVNLEEWVLKNGGNYYLKGNTRLQTNKQRKLQEEKERREKEKRRIAKIRAKKIIAEPKIKKHEKKVKKDRVEREKIAKLSPQNLITQVLEDNSRPIYFYEDAVFELRKNQITQDCKIKINQLIEKISINSNRKTKKIIEHLMNISS